MTFTTYAILARPGDVWLDKRIVSVMPKRKGTVELVTVPAAGGRFGELQTTERDEHSRIELMRR